VVSVVSGISEVYEIDDQIDFELISHETNSVFSYLNKSEIFAD
jgi:lysyl-tRNA synthetase class II